MTTANSRNLAEELLREMPDMKHEIELELCEKSMNGGTYADKKSPADNNADENDHEELTTEAEMEKITALELGVKHKLENVVEQMPNSEDCLKPKQTMYGVMHNLENDFEQTMNFENWAEAKQNIYSGKHKLESDNELMTNSEDCSEVKQVKYDDKGTEAKMLDINNEFKLALSDKLTNIDTNSEKEPPRVNIDFEEDLEELITKAKIDKISICAKHKLENGIDNMKNSKDYSKSKKGKYGNKSTEAKPKSIIEVHISNKTVGADECPDAEIEKKLECIRMNKEQAIIELNELKRQDEQLSRSEAINNQLNKYVREQEKQERNRQLNTIISIEANTIADEAQELHNKINHDVNKAMKIEANSVADTIQERESIIKDDASLGTPNTVIDEIQELQKKVIHELKKQSEIERSTDVVENGEQQTEINTALKKPTEIEAIAENLESQCNINKHASSATEVQPNSIVDESQERQRKINPDGQQPIDIGRNATFVENQEIPSNINQNASKTIDIQSKTIAVDSREPQRKLNAVTQRLKGNIHEAPSLKSIAEKSEKSDKGNNIQFLASYVNAPEPKETNNIMCDQQLPSDQITPEEKALDESYRASGAIFLQHMPCFKLRNVIKSGLSAKGPKTTKCDDNTTAIPNCRECRRRYTDPQNESSDVYCRFYEFRRLKYVKNELVVEGFPNPRTDPTSDDLNIWQPDEKSTPTAGWMDIQVARYILLHAGDQFCYLYQQEAEALKIHENSNKVIAWKKVVKGIREICDVCDTTLFNFHWTCEKCGFGVCLDCFKDRKEQRSCRKRRTGDKPQRGHDEFHWMLCTDTTASQEKHELRDLMLTQIIAGDALNVLNCLMHDIRALWQIPQICGCQLSKQVPKDSERDELIQDMIKESQLKQQTSASSLATEETMRKQGRMEKLHAKKMKFAAARTMDYVPGRVWTKETLGEDPITSAFNNFKHINFHRKGLAGLRRFLPPRVMTLAYSTMLAPGVPHEWLCDGKLLRLTNPMHPDNRILFQEVWKCGQPVMISEVARSLNLDLWRPEAFCRDFGEKPNDLINCLNGNLVPNQPMKHFWEGFQCIRKRLLDANGKQMLLKLKDWPPGDDFAEILPTRFADLMKGLPMPEYTLRTGNLNIASCLPKMFVPPDLGPKMYNAYGSALHPDKGTTNLHLDISDAVNIMVYVGVPQDEDSKRQLQATQRAIVLGGSEYTSRLRSHQNDVLPGALWHIFPARDADKIRDLLNRVTLEKGFRLEPDHDPIHDQNWYLDDKLRARLFKEYGVEGYPIIQCLGDAIFVPAGAPHQVQNLHNCIKVAEDFVSPENITHCYHLTHEFRRLSNSHTNHEDKLQIKNIIYHAIKDCCQILMCALNQRVKEERKRLHKPASQAKTDARK